MITKENFRVGQSVNLKVKHTGSDEGEFDDVLGVVSEVHDDEVMLDLSGKDGYSIALYYWEIHRIIR